jgi:hypothetical protein
MTAQEQFEKNVDAFFEKYRTELAPVVAKSSSSNEPTTPRWLNISEADESRITLLRAEADRAETSPEMRSRLARSALKVMGLDDLFITTGSPREK